MSGNQLRTKNGVLQFSKDCFVINDHESWWDRKGRILFAVFLVGILTLTRGLLTDSVTQITIGAIALVMLLILGAFSINSYKGRNEFDFNLIQTKFIRSVVFKKNPFNRYLTIIIFLPLNKYRVIKCAQNDLDESEFIAFLKRENITVVLP